MSDLSYLSLSTSLVPRIDKCIKKKTIEKVKKKNATTEDIGGKSAIKAKVVSKRGVPKVF